MIMSEINDITDNYRLTYHIHMYAQNVLGLPDINMQEHRLCEANIHEVSCTQ